MIVKWNSGVGFVKRRSAEEERVIEGGGRGEEEYGLLFCLDLSAVAFSLSSKCYSTS